MLNLLLLLLMVLLLLLRLLSVVVICRGGRSVVHATAQNTGRDIRLNHRRLTFDYVLIVLHNQVLMVLRLLRLQMDDGRGAIELRILLKIRMKLVENLVNRSVLIINQKFSNGLV